MAIRAYQIAFEKGVDIRVLMEIARRAGISVKTHMSALALEDEGRLRGAVERLKDGVALPEPAAALEAAPDVAAVVAEAAAAAGVPDGTVVEPAPEPKEEAKEAVTAKAGEAKPGEEEKAPRDKVVSVKKRKRIKEEAKPLDSAEILEELKGRFLSSAMKDLMGTGRRPVRPRTSRTRRPIRGPGGRKAMRSATAAVPVDREVEVLLPVTVKNLSKAMGIKAPLIQKQLMESGAMLKMNDHVSEDLVELLALEFGRQVKFKRHKDVEEIAQEADRVEAKEENLTSRAPVVTFLGHVDHGKTSLLDRIRKTRVAEGEAGGITQHIGAYRVQVNDRTVVFLDTPGHEAFTDMRARGAQVTDIVVLVVAADDGVMPQTEEAIAHAKAAGVPIVVALNKVDKADPGNIMRAKQQLASQGLELEEWGGETLVVETSATLGKGIAELLDALILVSDLLDLKADPAMPARGTVLEAQVHEGRGVLATVLIMAGTLRVGDTILGGQAFGRVRAIYDEVGREVEEAGPSTPVMVSGFTDLPSTGDRFLVMDDEAAARRVAAERALRGRVTTHREHVTLDNLFSRLEEGEIAEVPIVLKADGQGSIAALVEQLENLSTREVKVRILHTGVGGINESDILLAHASDAIVLGFHVVPGEKARSLAQERGVDVRLFNVIYKALDDIRAALEGTLAPEEVEQVKGHVEIRQVFRITRVGNVAGCYVRDGLVERNDLIRIIRNDVVIYENGRLQSLKRHKDDVREVKEGFECGIKLASYEDVKVGDVLESYVVKLVPRKLSPVDNE